MVDWLSFWKGFLAYFQIFKYSSGDWQISFLFDSIDSLWSQDFPLLFKTIKRVTKTGDQDRRPGPVTRTGDQDRWPGPVTRNRASFSRNRASFLRNRASFCGIARVFWGILRDFWGIVGVFQKNFQKKLENIEKGSICVQRSIYTLWSTYTQWSVKIRLPVTPVTASFIFYLLFNFYNVICQKRGAKYWIFYIFGSSKNFF